MLKWIIATNLKLFPAILKTYLSFPARSQELNAFFTSLNDFQSADLVFTHHSFNALMEAGCLSANSCIIPFEIFTISKIFSQKYKKILKLKIFHSFKILHLMFFRAITWEKKFLIPSWSSSFLCENQRQSVSRKERKGSTQRLQIFSRKINFWFSNSFVVLSLPWLPAGSLLCVNQKHWGVSNSEL